jgi:hypothetical protein
MLKDNHIIIIEIVLSYHKLLIQSVIEVNKHLLVNQQC